MNCISTVDGGGGDGDIDGTTRRCASVNSGDIDDDSY